MKGRASSDLGELTAFYLATNPSVARARLFGFDCLRAGTAVFIKVHAGSLVMKFPAPRLAHLVEVGRAKPYHRRSGQPFKEWAVVLETDPRALIALAEEARRFATST